MSLPHSQQVRPKAIIVSHARICSVLNMDCSNNCSDDTHPSREFAEPVNLPNVGFDSYGYDCEFIDPTPKALQTECSICLLTLREPHLISCCGHNFCRCCLDAIESGGKPCPLCKSVGFTSLLNKGLERNLKELKVRCGNHSFGCTWIGEFGKFDEHINSACLWGEIECKYTCGLHCKRRDIVGHQLVCPSRPFSCHYCGNYSSFYGDVVNNHWPLCHKYPISCPNHCGSEEMERACVQHHIDNECPLANVNCEFTYAGCQAKMQRKDIETHFATAVASHLSLVSSINQQLVLSNQQLLEQNRLVTKRMNELESANKLMQIMVSHISKALGSKGLLLPPLKFSPYQELRMFSKLTLLQPTQDFYSHFGGYKLQAQMYAQDELKQFGTVLYLRIYLQKGEYDEFLSWPFKGTVVLKIGSEQHLIDFQNAPEACRSRLHEGTIAKTGHGSDKPVAVMRLNYKTEVIIESVVLPSDSAV